MSWKFEIDEKIEMYVHKSREGSISFIALDHTNKRYSTDYYSNVGILNMGEPIKVSKTTIATMWKDAMKKQWAQVNYIRTHNSYYKVEGIRGVVMTTPAFTPEDAISVYKQHLLIHGGITPTLEELLYIKATEIVDKEKD